MTEQADHAPSTHGFVDEWMTPNETCHELQIPEQNFYQWRDKRAGPRAHRFGRHVRSSRTDFNAWLAQRKTVGMSEERRWPTRLTPATRRRGSPRQRPPLRIGESPSMATWP